jgi:hypothetical protein
MNKIIKLFLLISILNGAHSAFFQDIIKLKNGKEFNARVLLVTNVKLKYKKFENLEGPTLQFRLNNIQSIQYENGNIVTFDSVLYYEKEYVVESWRLSRSPSSLYLKGYQDGRNQFENYKTASTGTFWATFIAGGIPGLIPAIGCSSVSPKLELIQISSTESTDYVNGYIAGAKAKKSKKVWKNWGIAYGIRTVICIGVGIIAAEIFPLF